MYLKCGSFMAKLIILIQEIERPISSCLPEICLVEFRIGEPYLVAEDVIASYARWNTPHSMGAESSDIYRCWKGLRRYCVNRRHREIEELT